MSTEMSARSFSSSSRSLARPFKVLFCGHEFSNGYLFSKAALSRKLPTVVTTQCSRENLHKELADADVVVPLMCKMGHAELQIGKNIRMIMQYGVGLEGVDVPAATQAGVWVCKIPSEGTGNAQSCAEHAIFLSLALLRNMSEMKRSLLSGGLGLPMGRTLFKSTAIVYGYGGIGKQLVNRLKAFEMNIIVVSRNGADDVHTETEPGGGGSSVICIRPQQMATTLEVRSADVLYVCCSQNAENMGFVNKAFLSGLKPGVMLVNVARVSANLQYQYSQHMHIRMLTAFTY